MRDCVASVNTELLSSDQTRYASDGEIDEDDRIILIKARATILDFNTNYSCF
jgi:hypothetical protein